MRARLFALLLVCTTTPLFAQIDTKKLLEDYSLQLFEENATGFMSPLVIVTNVGANHGFYHSARVDREDRLSFELSVQSMTAWVRDDQRSFTARVPLDDRTGDDFQLLLFKDMLRGAVRAGEMKADLHSATVFGTDGEFFRIPKEYIKRNYPFIPESVLDGLPDSLSLTNGINRDVVYAAVPQLQIGTFKNTDMIVRYIPPVVFDTAVGKFSFYGVALRHGVTNWFDDGSYDVVPFDAAVQVSYQHSTIDNTVGDTRARLAAKTDMLSVNVHASRRFWNWFEPFVGLSFEHLSSKGSYTFTLPKNVTDQIGYDIDPQTARISLEDNAVKATVGVSAMWNNASAFVSAGFSKHVIVHAGLSYLIEGIYP